MRTHVIETLRAVEDDWSRPDAAVRVAARYSLDAVLRDMTGDAPVLGREAIAEAMSGYTTAFSDFRYSASLVCDDGVTAVVEWTAIGRHTGSLAGEEPTGRAVHLRGLNLLLFDEEGLINEERSYWDYASLERQLGPGDPA